MNTQIAQEALNYIADRNAGAPDDYGWNLFMAVMDVDTIQMTYEACDTLDEALAAIRKDVANRNREAQAADVFLQDFDELADGQESQVDDWEAMEDEHYQEWVAERASSIFYSGADSHDAMFMARQEAAHRFPEAHQRAMMPPSHRAHVVSSYQSHGTEPF